MNATANAAHNHTRLPPAVTAHHATGAKTTVWAFVGVLGYSRYMTVRLVVRCDLETTLDCLEVMLR